jgi:hypothetical protein
MFTWIPIYTELARKILAYRSRQSELVEMLKDLDKQGIPVNKAKFGQAILLYPMAMRPLHLDYQRPTGELVSVRTIDLSKSWQNDPLRHAAPVRLKATARRRTLNN